jgi:hypothetical protein
LEQQRAMNNNEEKQPGPVIRGQNNGKPIAGESPWNSFGQGAADLHAAATFIQIWKREKERRE